MSDESRGSNKLRLRRSATLFRLAGTLGLFALLFCAALLIALGFASVPRSLWISSFVLNIAALCGQLAAWLTLSYRSGGYGVSGSFLYWEYWLLSMASFLSASLTFTGYQRYVAFVVLAIGVRFSTQLVPLLWSVPYRSAMRFFKLASGESPHVR